MQPSGEYRQRGGKASGRVPSSGVLGESHFRIRCIMVLFIIAYVIIGIRVIDVAVFGGKGGRVVSSLGQSDDKQIFHRADIVDRNGVLLAINLATASLYANPQVMLNVEEAIKKLRTIFPDMDEGMLWKRLTSDKQFVWIKRNLTPVEQHAVNSLGIPGLYFQREEKRVYPHKNLFSHIIGYVNIDGKGIAGAERYFDEYLKTGWQDTGQPLQLSLDVRVQQILHEEMTQAVDKYNAAGASGIVMDVKNGEIMAIVSLPDFDPHDPGTANPKHLFNKSTLGVYEMGSTFKTFTMAFGLESEKVSIKDTFDVSSPLKIDNFTIKDFHAKKPVLTFPEVYIYSSNIGSAHVALKAGAKQQRAFLKKLGLLDEAELEVPELGKSLYPDPWGRVHTVTISYGHGIAVTPIQLTQAVSAVVNGGLFNHATLIKGNNSDTQPTRVVKKTTSDNIRKLMRFAVEYGTGGNADVQGYFVGGKTGSADKASVGGYKSDGIISSFVGVFPMNDPKYTVFILLDDPKDDFNSYGYATGGIVAAPVVGDVIERIGPILGVQPVNGSEYNIRKEFWYDNERGTTQGISAGRAH